MLDGPMGQHESYTDWASVERYIDRCIRAERRMWASAFTFEVPEVKLDEIEDADTRRQVRVYFD